MVRAMLPSPPHFSPLFNAMLIDSRNIPALGRVGDPDDIIGSVLVEDSQVSFVCLL